MDAKLLTRLKNCNSLPTLPAVAAQLIELGRDPNASMEDVARVVRMDPAISAKILRMANSPVYARRRRCDNFQQALVVLGLNATMTVALTFTLAKALRAEGSSGLDLERFWRRTTLSAVSCRMLGVHLQHRAPDDLFFAALLQDIGVLALDRAVPEMYAELPHAAQTHAALTELELERLSTDHAEVGAWLLDKWKLPDIQQRAVRESHAHFSGPHNGPDDVLVRSVAVSGVLADIWFAESYAQACQSAQMIVHDVLGLTPEETANLLEQIAAALPEVEQLFDIELTHKDDVEWLLTEARDALLLRNLMVLQESSKLRETAEVLQAQARALEERSRIDTLTGVYNRGHLDSVLPEHFDSADRCNVPISVVFIDIDDFKLVNDRHGHHSGDSVLVNIAEMLRGQARNSDVVARYGGEEFVVVLPGTGAKGALALCERVLARLRVLESRAGENDALKIKVTASIGVATHGESERFTDAFALCKGADKALYAAKRSGKDRVVVFDSSRDSDEAA
ncbi:MAG: GGDEF domain-containing protein [Gammaproteobacteria bacterium]|nr:GGDEF domain-containing protein [Gammaproteobacteria bacterium]